MIGTYHQPPSARTHSGCVTTKQCSRVPCTNVHIVARGGVGRFRRAVRSLDEKQPGTRSDQNVEFNYSDPVNALLGRFLPSNRAVDNELNVDFAVPKVTGLSVEELAACVKAGLEERQWCVTGRVLPQYFSDNFVFKDESVKTSGVYAYALGVRKVFDQDTAKMEVVAVEVAPPPARQIVVTWRLEGRVNIPGRPFIKPYVVTTFFDVDDQGLIEGQTDTFSIPGWELVLSAFFPGLPLSPPAPPVEELRRLHLERKKTRTG